MKYCKPASSDSGTCCDKDDFSTEACNDRLEDVICSNDLDYDEKEEPGFKRYMICPQSVEVCGEDKEVHLKVPDLLSDIIDEGLTLDKVIPPGYVCSYNVRVQQDDASELMTKLTVLQDLTDPGYTGRDKIKAGLFYYEFDEENEKVPKEYDLLDYKCNIYQSNCTVNVHDMREFYFSERGGSVDSLYIVVINKDRGNDATLKQPFRVHFERLAV